jgi:twitching motility protein PilT
MTDSHDRIRTALAQSRLFRADDTKLIEQVVQRGMLETHPAGTVLMRQGEVPDAFFVSVEGTVVVHVAAPGDGAAVEVGELAAPQALGEMGLILDDPRTATVTARTELVVARFDRRVFTAMFAQVPGFGRAICAALAQRLVETSRRVPLKDVAVDDRPGPEVVALLPMAFIQRHRVLPLSSQGNTVQVGLVDDPTPGLMLRIRGLLPGMTVQPVAITAEVFNATLQHVAGRGDAETGRTQGPVSSPRLDVLLRRMVEEGASDLHLSAGERPRWRLDGQMVELTDHPLLGPDEVHELARPVMPRRCGDEFDETSDTDFAYAIRGLARFRANLFRDHNGVGAVFRQIPETILGIAQLSLPPVAERFCDLASGLVLVTGPTGSGKSTTLAAMVDHINRRRAAHIITLEDPIEFVHQSRKSLINQREIGAHSGSFTRALKAALRQDPDIVLIGELRTRETIALALELANTGHLVLATMHTATAITTVDRIVDVFPSDQQAQVRTGLSETLRGVVAQTLCRRVGGGRIAAVEVLVVNSAVANLIREGKTSQLMSTMQTGRQHGNQTLESQLARLVMSGRVEFDEALMHTLDKKELARLCGQRLPGLPGSF